MASRWQRKRNIFRAYNAHGEMVESTWTSSPGTYAAECGAYQHRLNTGSTIVEVTITSTDPAEPVKTLRLQGERMKIVIYDAEIENAIPTKGEAPIDGIKYCKGWGDKEGMGISVVAAYVWGEGYRIFMRDNFDAFKALVDAADTLVVGFNNRAFDDLLVEAVWGVYIPPNRSWDLLRAIRVARGESPASVGGPGLNRLCEANFLPPKAGNGAFAPILWQKGKVGQVVDYCLGDVLRTKKLVELVIAGRLRDADSGRVLGVNMPTTIEPLAWKDCKHVWEVRNDGYGCRRCGAWQLTLDTAVAGGH